MIISIHIPKTAGTTFGALLQKKYQDKFLYVYNSNIINRYCVGQTLGELNQSQIHERETSLSKDEIYSKIKKLNIECIHGHFTYDFVKDAPDFFQDVTYVTWVREPEARTYSDYLHFLRNGYHGDKESLIKILANRMVQFMGTDPKVFSFIGRTEYFDEDLKRFGMVDNHTRLNVTPETEEDIDAKNLIKHHVDKDRVLYDVITKEL